MERMGGHGLFRCRYGNLIFMFFDTYFPTPNISAHVSSFLFTQKIISSILQAYNRTFCELAAVHKKHAALDVSFSAVEKNASVILFFVFVE